MSREIWRWRSPLGKTIDLTQFTDGIEVTKGVTGRFAPPTVVTRTRVPGKSGTWLQDVHHDTRTMTMPLYVTASSAAELRSLIGDLAISTNPLAGYGVLEHVSPDGTARLLRCLLHGLQQIGEGNISPTSQAFEVLIEADDPYFYDESWTTFSWGGATSMAWFGRPWFPLRLGSSDISGAIGITVTSNVETWPVWTARGPFTELQLKNVTAGKSLKIERTISAAEMLVVDTSEGVKTVRSATGANWMSSLTEYDFWPLAPGLNDLEFNVVGSSPATKLTLAYRNRHLFA